jgi:hypothetical protein
MPQVDWLQTEWLVADWKLLTSNRCAVGVCPDSALIDSSIERIDAIPGYTEWAPRGAPEPKMGVWGPVGKFEV